MDQEQYYTTIFKNLDSCPLNDTILDDIFDNTYLKFSNISSIPVNNNKEIIMIEHINNIHQVIYNYIKKKGIDNSFILELKSEINKYNSKITKLE